jgi:hypothetical protein
MHLAPYSLCLVSLYCLFSKSELPLRRGSVGWFLIVLFASYGVAGGTCLLLVVVGVFGFGPRAVDVLFSKMLPLIIAVAMVVDFPFVARSLR